MAGQSVRRGEWFTRHTMSWCADCDWSDRAEDDDSPVRHAHVVRAGLRHADATGHSVAIERAQSFHRARAER